MKKFLGTMTAVTVALFASSAMAGVYVSGALPSADFGGGWVSPNPDVHKAIGKASREGAKLAGGAAKCYSKGAKNVSKGNPSGVNTCINDAKKGVLTKYTAKVTKISTKSPLPPCHNFFTDGPLIVSLTKGFNPLIYCQSPSGAFLDQASF